jgi:hypothetical protein
MRAGTLIHLCGQSARHCVLLISCRGRLRTLCCPSAWGTIRGGIECSRRDQRRRCPIRRGKKSGLGHCLSRRQNKVSAERYSSSGGARGVWSTYSTGGSHPMNHSLPSYPLGSRSDRCSADCHGVE